MIPEAFIVEWSTRVRWPTPEQVEQDLVLSRMIVEIANDPYLGEELVFRGGTCFHKLHLPAPLRYSEDLDYVRRSGGGIAPFTRSVTAVGERLGMQVSTQMSAQPKVYLKAPFESGSGMMRIKVEVDTHERTPARELIHIPYEIDSRWFAGGAEVQTFCAAELVATKLRALYQRSKGRDLFDLWLALTELELSPAELIMCFDPYRPANYTPQLAERNLRAKLANQDFRADVDPLAASLPSRYDIDAAAELVIGKLFTRL